MKRTIAESLKPTFENVTQTFITETIPTILFDEEYPNFRFDFREPEAIEFIDGILQKHIQKYSFYAEKLGKTANSIHQKADGNETIPVMVINDYKQFFELIRKYYEKDIELFFRRTGLSGFTTYEQANCFEQIWLRATPEDFSNPENFLRTQVAMLYDTTFAKYDEETCIGKLPSLDNNPICVKNNMARTWDETQQEFKITIYDKKYYDNKELFERPNYTLPLIRYGIYEKDGKRICRIASIQNKQISNSLSHRDTLAPTIQVARKDLNKGPLRKANYEERVEPTKTLALSIFMNFLSQEEITNIEVPGMLVLDYDYHEKASDRIKREFDNYWTRNRISLFPKDYEQAKAAFARGYEKQDTISEIKTERLINTAKRLISHYPNGKVTRYPGDADNFLHLIIPTAKSTKDINGDILKQFYELVDSLYREEER